MCRRPSIDASPQPERALSERGFTLLEIMVALAILGGVIVTALTSIRYHLTVVDSNINKTLDAMLAAERLELVRLYGEPEKKDGDLAPEYEGFLWSYRMERAPYKGMRTEAMTVSRFGEAGVTIKTIIPEK